MGKVKLDHFLLAFGLMVASAGHCQEHLARPEQLKVTGVGSEPHPMTEACRSFTLTARQAAAYFESAMIIDVFEEHDHYAWAPCWVRGTALVNKKRVSWEIRAGLTARVVFPNGDVILLADPSQRLSGEE